MRHLAKELSIFFKKCNRLVLSKIDIAEDGHQCLQLLFRRFFEASGGGRRETDRRPRRPAQWMTAQEQD
jgi:hypothetical protein